MLTDIDRPGALTIVVQGSLFAGNLVETANHCVHWRELFPQAEIILAVAISDILEPAGDERAAEVVEPRLVPGLRHDGLLRTALARLKAACDKVVLSAGALPLPPLKVDSKANNINLQIAAAKAGLEQAGGTYTLRIRSDLVFLSREFLDVYRQHHARPRNARTAFRQRVMISPLFTLNPFTMERLPFHYSDWFHFGLTEDVRSIWQIGEMSLRDAMHHAAFPHGADSNAFERKFLLRFGIEQHINVPHLQRVFPELRLDRFNDPAAASASMRILLSDYLVSDLKQIRAVFNKYARALSDPNMELLCITHQQWSELIDLGPDADFARYYAGAARRARRYVLIREEPSLKPLKIALFLTRHLRLKLSSARRFARLVRSLRAR